jgi:hypothetical protein
VTLKTTEDKMEQFTTLPAHHHEVVLEVADINKLLNEGRLEGFKSSVGMYIDLTTGSATYGEVKEVGHRHVGLTIQCHYGEAPPKVSIQGRGLGGGGQA